MQIGFNRNEEPGFGYFGVIRIDYTGMTSTHRQNCMDMLKAKFIESISILDEFDLALLISIATHPKRLDSNFDHQIQRPFVMMSAKIH